MKMHLIVAFAAALILTEQPAFADPIVITGGSIVLESFSSPNRPPFGVVLLGEGTVIGAVHFQQALGFVRVGSVINPSAEISISSQLSAFGVCCQTIQGRFFENVALQGTLDFAAIPFTFSRPGFFTTPFTMTGVLSLFEFDPLTRRPGELLFSTTLTGEGRAGFGSFGEDRGDGVFLTGGFSYSFRPAADAPAPVPEPATLILVGTAILAVAGRALRRRKA